MLNMELNMMFWYCLWSLHALDIPEIYSRFNEYLATYADDKFDSLLAFNIMFRDSQEILRNKFCALGFCS